MQTRWYYGKVTTSNAIMYNFRLLISLSAPCIVNEKTSLPTGLCTNEDV